jgi:hypothetical protein
VFNGANLSISEEDDLAGSLKPGRSTTAPGGMFLPRKTAAPRPRAGLGSKKTGLRSSGNPSKDRAPEPSSSSQRGQEDFRKMLGST